jgi:hypothetical protein
MKELKKLIRSAFILFWICDILNMPFMEMFDTTYPLNAGFYCLVLLFLG